MNLDFLSNIDLTDVKEEAQKAKEPRQASYLIKPGVHNATIDNLYLFEADSGALAVIVDLTVDEVDENGEITSKQTQDFLWIKSGKNKGNKTTYTSKNGKEVKLPAWVQLEQILDIYGFEPIRLKQGSETQIEFWGAKQNVLNVNVELKEVVVPIKTQEGEYPKNAIIAYLNPNDKNIDEIKEKWEKSIEKSPTIKDKSNNKKDNAKKVDSETAKKAKQMI